MHAEKRITEPEPEPENSAQKRTTKWWILKSLSIVMQMKEYPTLLHFMARRLQIQNYLSSKPSTPQAHLKTKQKAQRLSLQWKRSAGVALGKFYHPERRLGWGGRRGREEGFKGGKKRRRKPESQSDSKHLPRWEVEGWLVTVESKSETYSESTFLETSLFRRPHLSPLLLLECIRE